MGINNNNAGGIQESFDTTLKDTGLSGLAVEMTELAIDNILTDGVLRDIPVINTLVSLTKFGASIQDKLFAKKILSFLVGLKDVPSEERNRVINEIDGSQKYRVKVGEKLLYIIDACNDFEGAERVSFVFRAFIKGEINYDEFLECSSILERITTYDFKWFLKNGNRYLSVEDATHLVASGLFDMSIDPVEVDIREKKSDLVIPEKNPDKEYRADVDGGDIRLKLSEAGDIILSLFNPDHKRRKTTKT
jgi:hypothetical protein